MKVTKKKKMMAGGKTSKSPVKPGASSISSKDQATALKKLNEELRSQGFSQGVNDKNAPKYDLFKSDDGTFTYRRKAEFAYGGKVYAKAGTMIPEMAKDPGLLAQMEKEVEKAKK